jgi:Tfp pilus assembly protein PilN
MKQKSSLAQLYTMRNDLNAQIKVVEQIKAKKTKTNIANNKPPQFSSYFVSLAEATPDSIWLTNIKFSNIDQTLSLGGYATNFIIIPYFLRNLSKLSDFPKGKISVLNFTKVDKGDAAGGISFQFGRT